MQLIAALVNDPDLLVLDEPFSGLDPLAITNMSELLTDVAAAGATVLFSSHQLDLVEDLCEDVVIIDHGRIVSPGTSRSCAPPFPNVRRHPLPRRRTRLDRLSPVPRSSTPADGHARLRVDRGVDIAHIAASSNTPPTTSSRSPTSRRPCPTCSARRSTHERLRQGWLVARRELRERSRSHAFLASVVIMILAVVAAVALPTLIDAGGGTKHVGLTGTTPANLADAITAQGDAVGTKTNIHHYDTLAAAEQAVRDGKIDVLVVDTSRLEWQRRADEQLRAVVTAAIRSAPSKTAPMPPA